MRPLAIAAFALLAAPVSAQANDLLGQCVIRLQAQFEAPQVFARTSRVTCPAADFVGFPPRQRRHNREAELSYTAPEGFFIENDNTGAIQVEVLSSRNGSETPPVLSRDGRTVSLHLRCEGLAFGQGEASHEVRLSGEILRRADDERMKSWLLDCAQSIYTQVAD